MTDLEPILSLWRELHAARRDYVLATVVAVEGSSYRKPGAIMLLCEGRRAGTISGGCLESQVAKRAFWLTSSGPVVERYSTAADDGDMPYGSGCGGAIHLLLERPATAAPFLAALDEAFRARKPLAVATVLDGPRAGLRAFAPSANENGELSELAAQALALQTSSQEILSIDAAHARVWVDYRTARPGLFLFGAGDDALPLVALARELSWYVSVADGRAHLATTARFHHAHQVSVLPMKRERLALPEVLSTDAAVVLTHSFEQDARILAALLPLAVQPAYVGVLGPQRRTRELLAESARLRGLAPSIDRIERELAGLHAPTGLDLGASTPAAIALSILAEVQQTLAAATGRALREVRASHEAVSHR